MAEEKKAPTQTKEVDRRTIKLSDRNLKTLQAMQLTVQNAQQAQATFLTNVCVEQYEYQDTDILGFDFNFATGNVLVVKHEVVDPEDASSSKTEGKIET